MHVNNWHPPTYLANTSLDKGHGHTSFQHSNGTYWNIVLQQLLLFCPQMLGFCVIVVVKNKKPLLDHTIQFIPPFFCYNCCSWWLTLHFTLCSTSYNYKFSSIDTWKTNLFACHKPCSCMVAKGPIKMLIHLDSKIMILSIYSKIYQNQHWSTNQSIVIKS